MNDKQTHIHGAYDRLLDSYFGGRHPGHKPMPPGVRPHAQTAEAVLGTYFGKPLPRIRHPLGYGQYGAPHHTTQHQPGAQDKAQVLSLSVDDGEVLGSPAEEAYEEYVVAQSVKDDENEYIVERSMSDVPDDEYIVQRACVEDRLSSASSVDEPMPAPRQELDIDILSPFAPPAAAEPVRTAAPPAPAERPAAPAAPALTQSFSDAPTPVLAPGAEPPTATDDDFMADMQAILTGERVFDPVTRKTVSKEELQRKETVQREEADRGQRDIFDRIAQSMQFANAYDLGTVELENRFADFDRLQDKGAIKPKPQAKSTAASVTPEQPVDTEEFLQDLEDITNAEVSPADVPAAG